MPPLPEMFSDFEKADVIQSENFAPIDIDLFPLNINVDHGIQNPQPLMVSKARITGLGYLIR